MSRTPDSCSTIGSSTGSTCVRERRGLLWQALRIDANDGSPVHDYRIDDGHVEHRQISGTAFVEVPWRPLSSEQLTSHVMANTVVARWLATRLGLHYLVRACNQRLAGAEEDLNATLP